MEAYQSLKLIKYIVNQSDVLVLSDYKKELWNKKYEALNLHINGRLFKSRLANKTPNKEGYFLSIWQKNHINKNVPFHSKNHIDKVIITVIDGAKVGQFIFSKEALIDHGILSSTTHTGKMAIRVYPTWIKHLNATALSTQKWQSNYFIDLSDGININDIESMYLN
ncbi:MepB family protein [Staphylococcus agnetis]|uniref:MepB family protein n=1 Tax=Staphylococcus agnetis TaxID=985762 RepID=UPI00208DDDDD|nr:MepB family protein [Staphylococcus agnetis]MCO4327555.1 MepB family protein [Staphylococcus agnetis]MCO4338988.1 MepB family protein [Staphylococcus agnetis]MCO4341914.1 MepB family protein [Staphylococcus agnetis]MCO4343536.1 MepB family protein [Staphylococcus agnetis]MCO4345696.1 MepB family protein [Staphylococcus agnetis]